MADRQSQVAANSGDEAWPTGKLVRKGEEPLGVKFLVGKYPIDLLADSERGL